MLAKQGAVAENVRFAVLINNICSRARVDNWSREIDRNMHKDWFVFPWEAMGTRDAHIDDANAVQERVRYPRKSTRYRRWEQGEGGVGVQRLSKAGHGTERGGWG